MSFNTLLDLAKQAKIKTNDVASFDGSMSIGQSFFIKGVQIDTTNSIQDYVLAYDPLTNSYKSAPQAGAVISGNRVFFGMTVSGITNLTYFVSNGIYKIQDTFYSFTGDTVSINSGDSTYARYDIIYVSGGTQPNKAFVLQGTPSATPVIPTVTDPTNEVAVAILYVPANTATFTGGPVSIYFPSLINAFQVIYSRGIYTQLDQYLDGNYVRPQILSFTNSLNELQFGQTATTVTFNWTTNKTGYNYSLNPTGNTYNNTTFSTTFNSQVITGSTASTATTFSLTFYDGISSINGSSSVKFYNKRYYGQFSGTSITNNQILSLPYNEFAYSNKMDLKYLSGGSKYMYFCQPVRQSEPTFFVNGMYFTDFDISTINLTNEYGFTEPYYIYKTTNIIYSSKMMFEIR